MKKALFTLYLTTMICVAYTDGDMDGVEDSYDKCPQTPLIDLVDYEGCSIGKTSKEIYFSTIFGVGYSQMNYSSQQSADTLNSYIQANIYFDRWYFQGAASYYRSDTQTDIEKGVNDTILNIFYKFLHTNDISLNLGFGAVVPTYKSGYNNEAADYKGLINFEYYVNEKNYLFSDYSYAWINDRDLPMLKYQDTQSFNIGMGYIQNSDITYNVSYSNSDSIYKNIKTIQTLGVGCSLDVDLNRFVSIYYDYGLSSSASNHSVAIYAGYRF